MLKRASGDDYNRFKWDDRYNLTITLKFIGDIEEKRIDDILNNVTIPKLEFEKLTLELEKFGFFERNGRPSIFWLSCNFNSLLLKFVSYIESALFEAGFPKEEKKFKSHITLLRLRGDENLEPLTKLKEPKFEKISFKPEAISLMKSELSPKGAKYFVIKNLVN